MRIQADFSLDFPRAYGTLEASADFRTVPEDFQVTENLGFEPAGEGEHVYLWIEKRGENTAWVAEQLAVYAGVKPTDIGYAGRKDRHAITRQWFSVYLPLKSNHPEPEWQGFSSDRIQVLRVARHVRKLRRGEHESNHFVIGLRQLQCADKTAFHERLDCVLRSGVPNYFGEQRFGNAGRNLIEAESLLVGKKPYRDRQKRGLILSAARSYLFNQVLADRVRKGDWQISVAGEPCAYPSGPLWGRGRPLALVELLARETELLSSWRDWCNELEHVGMSQERRALLLAIKTPSYRWLAGDHLELAFTLEAGAFATSVLRELVSLNNQQLRLSGTESSD